MSILIVGASGTTGKQVVGQLLSIKQKVKVIVRSPENLPDSWKNHPLVTIVKAEVSQLSEDEMADIMKDCRAIISCLGHNLTFSGIYGKPLNLVTDAVRLLCNASKKNSPQATMKFVLMNTSGNKNRDLKEPISIGERLAVGLIRLLLPPHADNEKAADYLRVQVGQNDPQIQWVVVRPDSLIDDEDVTDYKVFASPQRSAIFNAGKTSRINVGNFMAKLVTDQNIWDKWKGQMPIIYNKEAVLDIQ